MSLFSRFISVVVLLLVGACSSPEHAGHECMPENVAALSAESPPTPTKGVLGDDCVAGAPAWLECLGHPAGVPAFCWSHHGPVADEIYGTCVVLCLDGAAHPSMNDPWCSAHGGRCVDVPGHDPVCVKTVQVNPEPG